MNPHIPPLNCIQGKVHSLLEYSDFYFVCAYVPNSKDGLLRLPYRIEWEEMLRKHLMELDKKKPLIIIPPLQQKSPYPLLFKVNLT